MAASNTPRETSGPPPHPSPRLLQAAGLDNAFCGEDFDRGALWRYNPANNNWVLLARIPHDPRQGGGGFIGGKFYVVEDLGAVDIYDAATNSWSSGPRRPFRRCTPTSTTLQAKLYLVGCHDDLDGSGNWPVLVFDPNRGSWSQAAVPPGAANGLPGPLAV